MTAAARRPARGPDLDRSVPALLFKIGRYPLHHGTVTAIRTLGRAGVPVYAVTEGRFTPAAVSRHLVAPVVWRTSAGDPDAALVRGLLAVRRRVGRRLVVIPTDDEASVFCARHRACLSDGFLLPDVAPALPAELASKRGLHEICGRLGVPRPDAWFPTTADELSAVAASVAYPVVVKNVDPFVRLHSPAVRATTVVRSAGEMEVLASRWAEPLSVMVQEYIPDDAAEDWIYHAYAGAGGRVLAGFTGVKMRSWPPRAGVTTYARVADNEELLERGADLCRRVGYAGAADRDWRYDRRDGRYKLVDFNPRVGAQFGLFVNDRGVDVVRALHLDLTGRRVPPGRQADGHRLVVEHLDVPAWVAYRGRAARPLRGRAGGRSWAWMSTDDPAPVAALAVRLVGPALGLLAAVPRRRLVKGWRRAARRSSPPSAVAAWSRWRWAPARTDRRL